VLHNQTILVAKLNTSTKWKFRKGGKAFNSPVAGNEDRTSHPETRRPKTEDRKKAKIRTGPWPIQLNVCALRDYQMPVLVGTLAAAYAEAGRFSEAIATAQKARDLAEAAGQGDVAEKNRQLLELYRSGRAYHEEKPEARIPKPERNPKSEDRNH
jgi:hypothetical protein